MRHLQLGILLSLAGALPLFAEEFPFQESEGIATYRAASNFFLALVRHPFRVVKLAGRNIEGTLSFTPGHVDKGLKYSLEIAVSEMDEPTGAVATALANMLATPKIKISGNSITVLKPGRTPHDPFTAVVRPRIEIGEHVSYPEIRLVASMDGRIVRWEFDSQFTISEFGLWIPTKWGVPTRDKVYLEGEVSFSPKE